MAQADAETAKKNGYPNIQDIREQHQENRVHFELKVPGIDKLTHDQILKKFKLQSSLSMANIVAFDHNNRVGRYATTLDVIREWFDLRQDLYHKRKAYLLAKLQKECEILKNKVRFILAIVKGDLKVNNKKRKALLKELKNEGYTMQSQLD